MKLWAIFKREMNGYFTEPIAYVLAVVLLVLFGFTTFSLGDSNFFEIGEASLTSFFKWHFRIYLFLIPAIGMNLWAGERQSGNIELLMTFPVSTFNYVLGKFLASWLFIGLCLILTFPIAISTAVLGDPDFGVMFCGYLASFLMSGVFIAITSMTSAMCKNQISSFLISFVLCFLLLLFGDESLTDYFKSWVSPGFFRMVSSLSITTPFLTLSRGVIDFRSLFYFFSMTLLPIILTTIILKSNKSRR